MLLESVYILEARFHGKDRLCTDSAIVAVSLIQFITTLIACLVPRYDCYHGIFYN